MQTYTRSKEKGEIMMKNRTSVSKFEEFLKNVIKPSKDSSKDILERVLSEIKLLEEEYAGLCPINVLKANFCVDDMPEEKMDDILRSFREKGIIQEAQEGYLKYCY